jgi:IS5 family transposase
MSDQIFDRKVTTPAEREALKVFRPVEPGKTMTEHEKAQKFFHENRERLKTERLAREAADKANRV